MQLSVPGWRTSLAHVAAGLVATLAAGLVVGRLDAALAPGAGGIWLALTLLLGGLAVELRQRGRAVACGTAPRLRPLQVSCLAALGLGALLLRAEETPGLLATLPALSAPWLPAACILGGIAGLAALSLTASCRDAAFVREE